MYTIDTDKARLDIDLIHDFLAREAYWTKNIPKPLLVRAIEHSLCFGAYDERQQVGFARVISDFAVFAYVGDVFILPEHRGRGVSKMLMQAILEHPSLQGLRRWSLVTRDAHGLYRQFGFTELADPGRHMEKVRVNPYQ
jgi:GNAT superfamily N-acetyltransferase